MHRLSFYAEETMFDVSRIILFVSGALIIIVIPGPNILYLVARSIHQGRTAGLMSVLGIEAATLIHICAAMLGLTSLLLSSALAFTVVKYLGAAYLIYLGVRKLLEQDEIANEPAADPVGLKRIFLQGFFVNLFNPKTAMFFLAFLPQFVNPGEGNAALQIVFYGVVLVVLAILVEIVYVVFASRLGSWLGRTRQSRRKQRRLAAGVYIGLGLTTALSGQNDR